MDEQAETGNSKGLFLDWEKHDGSQAPLSEYSGAPKAIVPDF